MLDQDSSASAAPLFLSYFIEEGVGIGPGSSSATSAPFPLLSADLIRGGVRAASIRSHCHYHNDANTSS